jgi:hypothetical protein
MWGLVSMTSKNDWFEVLRTSKRTIQEVILMPIIMLVILPVLSVAQMPNPINEVRRISGSESSIYDRWTESDLKNNLRGRKIQEMIAKYSNESMGYFGFLGNSTEIVFGLNNYLGISSQESLYVNTTGRDLGCEPLLKNPPEILVVAWTDFPCGGYESIEEDQASGVMVYRRKR